MELGVTPRTDLGVITPRTDLGVVTPHGDNVDPEPDTPRPITSPRHLAAEDQSRGGDYSAADEFTAGGDRCANVMPPAMMMANKNCLASVLSKLEEERSDATAELMLRNRYESC